MKIGSVGNFRVNTLAVVAAGLLSACAMNDNVKGYFQDKPQVEFEAFQNNVRDRRLNSIEVQAKLDSLAYRDLFNATEGIKDSAKIKEFNDIANRANSVHNISDTYKHLSATGITVEEYDKLMNSCRDSGDGDVYRRTAPDYHKIIHKADSIHYRKFFEKHGLLDSLNLIKFNEITEKIRPIDSFV